MAFVAAAAAVTGGGADGGALVRAASGVVAFPPPGSCHVRGSGLEVLPDPACTPGATDPRVTQGTIETTICAGGWSRRVRPPYRVTGPEKRAAVRAYGRYAGRRLRSYELDHLIPLELGGAPNLAANLWPETVFSNVGAGRRVFIRNPKDRLENVLHRRVCDGVISLSKARVAIATDWVSTLHRFG